MFFRILAGVAAVLVLVATLVAYIATDGANFSHPIAQVTITVTSHTQVHVGPGQTCYVRTPQRYGLLLLSSRGIRTGAFGYGRLTADGGCTFTAHVPALPEAYRIIVNGQQHFVADGVGEIQLSADDGYWKSASESAL